MNSQIAGLRVASVVFALIFLGQLLRLVTRTEVIAGGYSVPLWLSAVAVVIAGGLSFWLWILSYKNTQ